MSQLARPRLDILDHKHDRWSRDGNSFLHEHVTSDNMTHSTDAFTREGRLLLLISIVVTAGAAAALL